ncbi:N-acetyltransferase [Oscillatoria sp. FACHB-1407]|uniref:GNAT family N-acetyltransferase n=1 Tax=Oscillatoria sp. FACHB-1407 TaxID=2692847 RepID=UPI001683CE4B|nr:GNAT family N-acetyltransferase [Oscillatoria sp. FACHB-1407]MBD2460511.1 N-acetyltransferase [Oscillatoria sp. FACHB-1407]
MSDVIRNATEADLPKIVEIYNRSIPGRMATADLEPVTVASRVAWFQVHDVKTRPIWVLERQGEIAAWISLSSFYGRPAYQATAEVSIYVAPNYQGQGVGSYLLQTMIDRCPEFGVTTLLGFVFGHNAPSLKMLEKVGFERWGLLPAIAKLDDQMKDLVILGLKISNREV